MQKPKIFISSTVHDFADLRAALKYYLAEYGFDVQLSDHSDFDKDSAQNSYEACLSAIEDCDYFILLVGSRAGGMYDEVTSITRKEYQHAYDLAQSGKIKKILSFVRKPVWDVMLDRKSLESLLNDMKILDNDENPFDKNKVVFHDSAIVKNADHLHSFIEEITRKSDFKKGKSPQFNWVHTFTHFEEIVTVLKTELKLSQVLSVKIAEQSLRTALINNLKQFTFTKSNDKVSGYFIYCRDLRKKLSEYTISHADLVPNTTIRLTTDEVKEASTFFLLFRTGIKELSTYIFESLVANGVFLIYDKKSEAFTNNNFCKALENIISEIQRVKQFEIDFTNEKQGEILAIGENVYSRPDQYYKYRFFDLALLCSIYERLENILSLTSFMLQYMDTHDEELPYPDLLNGYVPSEKPTHDQLLKIFLEK